MSIKQPAGRGVCADKRGSFNITLKSPRAKPVEAVRTPASVTTRAPLSRPAVVLGACETGLAVARGLGRAGIRVLMLDGKKDIAFRSRFVVASICPIPRESEDSLIRYLEQLAAAESGKPVLFITSDTFISAVSRNRDRLAASYEILMPPEKVVAAIVDKQAQVQLAAGAGIPVPRTVSVASPDEMSVLDGFPLPAIVKARDVTRWRSTISPCMKGFVATSSSELIDCVRNVTGEGLEALVQELIPGPDENHFKVCAYLGVSGEPLLAFGLRKIRQCPPGAGFGCLVESFEDPELMELGLQFLRAIDYRGVGSAEFKRDARTGQLVLIELNPRYWQQTALAERCGMNFALTHYMDVTQEPVTPSREFDVGVKWVNLHRDLDSFRDYRRAGQLSTWQWLRSLRGPIMDSCFALDDQWPGVYALTSDPLRRVRDRLFGSRAARASKEQQHSEGAAS